MQHIPQVTEQDVERIVRRDHSPEDVDEILHLIELVEVREKERVVLACLKNADGNMTRLKDELESASGYWREIISKAEYPLTSKRWNKLQTLPESEREKVSDKDWAQYQEWLNRKTDA